MSVLHDPIDQLLLANKGERGKKKPASMGNPKTQIYKIGDVSGHHKVVHRQLFNAPSDAEFFSDSLEAD